MQIAAKPKLCFCTSAKFQGIKCSVRYNLHKILFLSISKQIGFELAFQINHLDMLFFILSYYLPSGRKKARDFSWSPTRALPWIRRKIHSAYRPPPSLKDNFVIVFHEITFENWIFFQKTDISKTAWINPWVKTNIF